MLFVIMPRFWTNFYLLLIDAGVPRGSGTILRYDGSVVGLNQSAYQRTNLHGFPSLYGTRKSGFPSGTIAEVVKPSAKPNNVLGRIDWAAKYLTYGQS